MAEINKLPDLGIVSSYFKCDSDAGCDVRPGIFDLKCDHGTEIRPFTVEEAKAAREAFITSATNHVMPVVRIDGAPIGNGAPGLTSQKLRNLYYQAAEISST